MPLRVAAGSAAQLVFRHVQLIGVELGIVFQDAPGKRVVFLAQAHEAAEAHDRIGDLAGPLLDHHAFDGSDLLSVRAADRSSLNLVAGDQGVGFADVAALFRGLHHHAPFREMLGQRSGEKHGSGFPASGSRVSGVIRSSRAPGPQALP
jgi:hypothetical protein